MSIGAGATLGGGLQVCSGGSCVSLYPPPGGHNPCPPDGSCGDPGGPGDGCSNPGGGPGGGAHPYGLNAVPLGNLRPLMPPMCIMLMDPGPQLACPPPTGLVPAPVPSSAGPYSQKVGTYHSSNAIVGPQITCVETGVTLAVTDSACASSGQVTFYHNTAGTKHYTTNSGMGYTCGVHNPQAYVSSSGQGDVQSPSPIIIQV